VVFSTMVLKRELRFLGGAGLFLFPPRRNPYATSSRDL
jgi:hypothetical protein